MIRYATEDDIPRLVEMGQRFAAETVYRDRITVNPKAMARTAELLISGERGTVFVAEHDDVVVGMIGLLLFENPLSGEPTVSELFWWVDPEARGHADGLGLLKRAEQWAGDVGAEKVHMIAPTPALGHIYERLGYQVLETSYQRTL